MTSAISRVNRLFHENANSLVYFILYVYYVFMHECEKCQTTTGMYYVKLAGLPPLRGSLTPMSSPLSGWTSTNCATPILLDHFTVLWPRRVSESESPSEFLIYKFGSKTLSSTYTTSGRS